VNGEALRKVREASGLLQPDFAQRLGVHSVTLSRFERDRDPINRTVELAIYELARRLNVEDALPPVKSERRKLASKKKTK
jgi:transcriptional regulator with XRE-family HTH domain